MKDRSNVAEKKKRENPSLDVLQHIDFTGYSSLFVLISALKAKDPYTYYHVRRVACYSMVICAEMELHPQIVKQIVIAALAHDVGKIATPDRVLKKPGRLTKDEFLLMKDHPIQSLRLMEPFKELSEAMPIVRHHHERMDGYGYPDGLSGDEIPFASRVILVADTYDAMVSDRPYRRGCAPQVAFEELRHCSGSQFDLEVVEAFIRGMEKAEIIDLEELEKQIDIISRPS